MIPPSFFSFEDKVFETNSSMISDIEMNKSLSLVLDAFSIPSVLNSMISVNSMLTPKLRT